MTIDVKSCSSYAFKKFKEGRLRDDDPFGYISQLSSYVYAGKDDPLVTNKTHGAFLAVDKQNGHICLDVYDFSEELKTKEKEIGNKLSMKISQVFKKGDRSNSNSVVEPTVVDEKLENEPQNADDEQKKD